VTALDVADESSVRTALAEATRQLGGLDVVVNNAGIATSGAALDHSVEDFDRLMDTNLRGVWLVATEAARQWVAQKRPGAIINVASILGLRVGSGVAPYAMSKAGVIQMTKALALEWARHNIRVNALAPGYIATPLNEGFFKTEQGQAVIKRVPMRRLGELRDLDGPFLLLASEASRFMTGTVVAVDGGHLVSSL
jgi:NAD(P)-dependent dehydrogenase (short-subunit alcohol dehydrogenase family)